MATVYEKVGKMVNAVRLASDDYYQSIVPVFAAHDSENPDPEFKQFGNIITGNALIMNKFLKGFQDVILYESFQIHAFDNEFSRRFKKESDPLRRATFETFVNPVNPLQYDGEALDRILKLYPRDEKRVTYVRNREDIFPVSINREEAMSAFQSMEAFWDFYNQQYINLQNSNAIVEYNDIKQCFNANYASGAIKAINIHGKTPKEISTLLRELITRMTKPSSDFNNYINLEGATGEPVITNTPKESIVFMPDAETLAKLDTDVLAGAYNMEFADVTRNILAVDDFGYNVYDRQNQKILRKESSKIKAVLCDEYTLKFDEGLDDNLSGFNIASRTNQMFYHVWQTIALRPFCNCIVLVDDGEEPTPGENFELVIPDGGITFENGSVTLSYSGEGPSEEVKGVFVPSTPSQATGIIQPILFNVAFDDDTHTATLSTPNTPDGILTTGINASLLLIQPLSGKSIYITPFAFTASNVPVVYDSSYFLTSVEYNGENDVLSLKCDYSPKNVSPLPDFANEKITNITIFDDTTVLAYNLTAEYSEGGTDYITFNVSISNPLSSGTYTVTTSKGNATLVVV